MRFLPAIFFLLLALPAHAQNLQRALVVSSCGGQSLTAGPQTNLTMNPQGQLCIGGSIAPPYTAGPGDIVAGAGPWFGLRAYSAAYAAASGKAVNLRRASDNATCDFAVAASGGLGVSVATCATGLGLTPAVFATQDATASCTIATTTATCSGASSTPHAGSTITGAGLTQPCYASAVGTFTAGAGTVTLGGIGASPCGTIGSAASLTFTYGLYTTTAYDQSGAGLSVTQATAIKQPQVLPLCINSLPCFGFYGGQNITNLGGIPSGTAPFTLSAVSFFSSTAATQRVIALGAGLQFGHGGALNTAYVYNGAFLNGAASDGVWHALQGVSATGTTGLINVDGVSTTGSTGTTASATSLYFGSDSASNFTTGFVTEGGFWRGIGFTAPQLASMCHNQFAYWGTPTSC